MQNTVGKIEEEKTKTFSCPSPFSDEYPVIWFEPNLDSEEKKTLKGLIEKNGSIHSFTDPKKAKEFAQSLEISFLLIISDDKKGEDFIKSLKELKETYKRRLADFEEESILKQLLKEGFDRKSLKVYVFYTRQDFADEVLTNEEMDKMLAMYNFYKESAREFREEYLSWESPQKGQNTHKEDSKSSKGEWTLNSEKYSNWLECANFCERGLEDMAKIRRKEKLKMICFVNLAESFANFGVHVEAVEYYQKAFGIINSIYGEIHPSAQVLKEKIAKIEREPDTKTRDSYCLIAGECFRLKLQRNALHYYMKALELSQMVDKKNHREAASLYNQIGVVYSKLREEQKALDNYFNALKISREKSGENSAKNAIFCENIAVAYENLGDTGKTIEYYMKALDITKYINGEVHKKAAALYEKIARVYENLEDSEKKLEFQMKTIEVCEALDEKTPTAISAYESVARFYKNREEYQKALEFYLKALEIRKFRYERDPGEDLAESYAKVAELYDILEDYEKAAEHYMKSAETYYDFYIEDSRLANAYENTAEEYQRLEDFEKALEFQTKAVEIYKGLYGETHIETATSYYYLAEIYEDLKDSQKALEYHLKACETRKSLHGEVHADTALSYDKVAGVYECLEEYEKALDYARKSAEINEVVYGEIHEEIAISYNNLALVYEKIKDFEAALKYHLKALEIRESVLEEGHENRIFSEEKVAEMRDILGHNPEDQTQNEEQAELLGKRNVLENRDEEEFEPNVEKKKKQ